MAFPLLALAAFAAAASITPGPNNVMVAASGANHGFRATLPHCAGIMVGFAVMTALVGLGVAGLLAASPGLAAVLRWVGLLWLLLLAWRIARAGAPGSGPARPPMGFWGAALFQWINPKAWMMALGADAAFVAPDDPLVAQVLLVALAFFVVGLPCVLLWAALGSAMRRLLGTGARLRAYNVAMALLMVASMVPVVLER